MSEKVGGSSEKGVENYLEEKYGKDFVIERVAFGYFWYYMKDEPQYHYKGRFGNKEDDGEDYQEYNEAFYSNRNCRILSDYINEKLKEKNSNQLVHISLIGDKSRSDYEKYDISVEELLKSKTRTRISMYLCFPEKIGDINSETIKNTAYYIYNIFYEYNSEIEIVNNVYIFSDEDFPRVEKYFKESGDPVSSEFRNLTNDFTIISDEKIFIRNGSIIN
ncbi:MAG: hypothetical protein LBM93_14270 [Oscillospiraceae bacterium]|nr:hypothetical protein [Oscillospiraceae bacterium]